MIMRKDLKVVLVLYALLSYAADLYIRAVFFDGTLAAAGTQGRNEIRMDRRKDGG